LPNRLYNKNYLVKDKDDIYDTYLELIYNSDLFNPTLFEDSEVFQYNNVIYLASKYGQFKNNTAIFVKQEIEHILRTDTLINSMQLWNALYKEYKYESDNPYEGHIETYGNGYQYLSKSADSGQYLENGAMLLNNVKEINNRLFFDLISNEYIESLVGKPEKTDEYTPDILYRTLLYQMKWIYPYYTSENGLNIIKQIKFSENKINEDISEEENIPDEMPYNLTYSIYPRIMFNDEEQINMVLMLRLPSVIEEEQYEMKPKDVNINNIDMIQSLDSSLNVFN